MATPIIDSDLNRDLSFSLDRVWLDYANLLNIKRIIATRIIVSEVAGKTS